VTSTGKGCRRVLMPAAAVLLLAGLLALLAPHLEQRGEDDRGVLAQQQAGTASAPTDTDPATRATGTPSVGTGPASGAPAREHAHAYPPGREPWRPVVTGFAADLTRPGPDWAPRVTRWTSDYLAAEYRALDPSRAPTATLQAVEVNTAGESLVDVVAVYNTGLHMIIRAEDSVDGWMITRVEPAEQAPAGGQQ
jgi:hypothetical protein